MTMVADDLADLRPAAKLPPPTRDFEQGLANIAEYGVTVVPDVLTGDHLAAVRAALYREIEVDRQAQTHVAHPFDAEASPNVRVWNLVSKDPLFEDLATHPLVLDYVRALIGWPSRLSTLSGNINYPGAKRCVLHADQIWAPEPWPTRGPLGVNFGWCVDDFTVENGGTRLLPGSHRLNRLPREDESPDGMIQVEAKAGSLLIFESRLWHQTGENVTADVARAAIFGFYQKRLYMPAENWILQTNPEVVARASEDLLTLLGFKDPSLGMAD
jgi:ectoine hydroxylase-related dioxygenase (phytanoyl-CoA dioxygenase family)